MVMHFSLYNFLWELLGALGLMWVFHEEQRVITCLLLVKFSVAWRIITFIQSCGRHLASLLETTYLVGSYYVNCSEASKCCR